MRIFDNIVMSFIRRNPERVKDILSQSPLSPQEAFQKEILVNDFQQCMYMLRHYDTINWDLAKFTFGQILVVIGACWTILSSEKGKDESLWMVYTQNGNHYIVGVILFLSAFFVALSLAAILRNRTYFVLISRYLNEHRNNAIKNNRLGFENNSKMWQNPNLPEVLDRKSTQLLCVYLFLLCFGVLLFLALYSFFLQLECSIYISVIGLLIVGIPCCRFLYTIIK